MILSEMQYITSFSFYNTTSLVIYIIYCQVANVLLADTKNCQCRYFINITKPISQCVLIDFFDAISIRPNVHTIN